MYVPHPESEVAKNCSLDAGHHVAAEIRSDHFPAVDGSFACRRMERVIQDQFRKLLAFLLIRSFCGCGVTEPDAHHLPCILLGFIF